MQTEHGLRWIVGCTVWVLLCVASAFAVEVTIPDANLEIALRATVEVPDNGPITDANLAAITDLNADGYGITNLDGLQYCTGLSTLSIGSNGFDDLTPISGLIALDSLQLAYNLQLDTLDGIEGLTSLDYLGINALHIADISAISSLVSLNQLDMEGTYCPDFSPLAGLLELNTLYAANSNINDIAPLANCLDLQLLDIVSTPVEDLSALAGLLQLASVNITSTRVKDITPLADNAQFKDGDGVDVDGLLLNQASICDAIPAITGRGGQVFNLDETLNYCDPVPPVVTLIGSGTITLECPGVYAEQGATAEDDHENEDVTDTIVIDPVLTGPLDAGQYIVTYTATDAVGNEGTATRTINVLDTTNPVILRTGGAVVTVDFGTAYVDLGATASDVCDGVLSVSVDNPVNTNQVGSYTVTYTASDSAGNEATPVTRTVNVIDTVAPVLTLLGNALPLVECGSTYTDAGASASDVGDGNITAEIQVVGAVNTSSPGEYMITYTVSDSTGNAATAVSRTVTVADTTDPELVLVGNPIVNLECGDLYVEPGYSATDSCEGSVDVDVTGFVNVNVSGTYRLTYTAADNAGNTSITHRDVVVAAGSGCSTADPSSYPSDQNGDNRINLSELLRVIQFYNIGGFYYCPDQNTEDGFCPGVQP